MGKFQPSIGNHVRPPGRTIQKEKDSSVSSDLPQSKSHRFVSAERTPLFERLGFSTLREMGMIIWLVPAGLIFFIITYFCYRWMTMEWIDAEGYPISTPWWIWVLPFVFLGLGALTWRIVLLIHEGREDRSFRSPPIKPQPSLRQQKPKGFNMQRSSGFRWGQQESASPFSKPIVWIAVGAGVLLLIVLLVIIFIIF